MRTSSRLVTRKEWLLVNHSVLLDAHYRVKELLDQLIQEGIFDTNDYQRIMAQDTSRRKLRKLLNILPSKKADSFLVFKNAMSILYPDILQRCTPLPPVEFEPRVGQRQVPLSSSRKSKTYHPI